MRSAVQRSSFSLSFSEARPVAGLEMAALATPSFASLAAFARGPALAPPGGGRGSEREGNASGPGISRFRRTISHNFDLRAQFDSSYPNSFSHEVSTKPSDDASSFFRARHGPERHCRGGRVQTVRASAMQPRRRGSGSEFASI